MKLPAPHLEQEPSAEFGYDVWSIAGVAVENGAEIVVRFLSARDDKQRGLSLGTIGMLEIPETGARHDQFLIGFDPGKPCVLRVVKADGSLRFYPSVSDEFGHRMQLRRNQF